MSEDDDAERATVDAAAALVDATLNDYQDDLVEGLFGGEEPDKGNEVGDLQVFLSSNKSVGQARMSCAVKDIGNRNS